MSRAADDFPDPPDAVVQAYRDLDELAWSELPDAVDTLTDGPEQGPPYAQDFRVTPRLASASTVGQHPLIHTARHRTPAEVEANATAAVAFTTVPGDVIVRPAESSEALAWREPVRVREPVTTPGRFGGTLGVVLELVRVDLPEWRLAVVERVATFIRVAALNSAGQPIEGTEFATDGCGCYDPFPRFVHPEDPQGALSVRWSLLGIGADDPAFEGVPGSAIPNDGVQIQPHWFDLRYGWGQRYTTDLRLVVPSGVTSVRLLATVTSAASWSVEVGGRLAVWWVGGGPREAALEAAIHRSR